MKRARKVLPPAPPSGRRDLRFGRSWGGAQNFACSRLISGAPPEPKHVPHSASEHASLTKAIHRFAVGMVLRVCMAGPSGFNSKAVTPRAPLPQSKSRWILHRARFLEPVSWDGKLENGFLIL